ncbi:MAG TPA: zf-HC2 domain-containing protein [Chloroflexota bacterium]
MPENDDARCEAVRGQVVGYIVGTLDAAERERFLAHVQGCPDCAAYLAKLESAAALSCQELVELVTDYLEGRLSPAERERFETHLALCEGCANYVAQMRTTIRLAGRLTEDAVAPAAKQALLAAFRDWKQR